MSGDVSEYRRNSRAHWWQTDVTSAQRASRAASSSGIYVVDPLQASSFQLSRIVAPENLRRVWSLRRTRGGKSPGIDGMGMNLAAGEMMHIFRHTSAAIQDHRYRPAATRIHRIPKPNGRYRTIEIPTVIDRTGSCPFPRGRPESSLV